MLAVMISAGCATTPGLKPVCRAVAVANSTSYCEVSIYELLINPSGYDGDNVAVIGYVASNELPGILGAREKSVVGRIIDSEVIYLKGRLVSISESEPGFFDIYGKFSYRGRGRSLAIAVDIASYFKN